MFKKKLFVVLFSCFLLSGCSFFQKVDIGVVDNKKIVENSQTFQKIRELDNNILELEKNLSNKKESSKDAILAKEKELNEKAEKTFMSSMRQKEKELVSALDKKNKPFLDKKEKEMMDYAKTLEKDVNAKLDLLFVELGQATTSEERKKAIDVEITKIKQDADEKLSAKEKAIRTEVDKQLSGQRSELNKTLEEYAATFREEAKQKVGNEFNLYLESLFGEDQKKQNELKKEQAELFKVANEKIKQVTADIAKEKDLKSILVGYVVNVKCLDITDDVIKKLDE